MDLFDIKHWAGTEESLQLFLATIDKITPEMLADAEKSAATYMAEQEERPRLLSKQGNVGVITIAGPLVNSASWLNELFGMTGYPEIRDAVVAAVKDPEVKAILLDVGSGGGAVNGMGDASDLLKMVNAKAKPVYTFSGSMMASAALYLGVNAREIGISRMAEVGSIGILTVHREMSEMYKKMGISTTVMRAGKYKALGNPYEPLSKEAKEVIQDQLDTLYKDFAGHVADARDVGYAEADQKMGQGRVFLGQAGVDVGLADRITTFDEMVSRIQRGIDAKNKPSKYGANSSEGSHVKKALTEQEIAALAAGGGTTATVDTPAPSAEEQAAAAEAQAQADAQAAAEAQAAAVAAQAQASAPAAESDTVKLLKEQLQAANQAVVQLNVELSNAKGATAAAQAQLVPLTTVLEKMRPIVAGAVSNMRVACGASALAAGLSDEALLAEHASAAQQFKTKFPVGGVSSTTASDTAKGGKDVGVDPLRKARINATRPK